MRKIKRITRKTMMEFTIMRSLQQINQNQMRLLPLKDIMKAQEHEDEEFKTHNISN